MNGKGDKQRPTQVSRRVLELRWQLAFGKLTPSERLALEAELKERD